MKDDLLISPALPEDEEKVLRLVFDYLPEKMRAERVEAVSVDGGSGGASLHALLEARRQGRLVGGVLAEIQVGRTAVVWPPRVVSDEPADTAEQLLAALLELLEKHQVCAAHALLEVRTAEYEQLILKCGFSPLAKLLYLLSGEEDFPRSRPSVPLGFEPYGPANHSRLAEIVQGTYEETLDCPHLDGVRQIEDVLAGYRATGVFSPSRWLIVQDRNRDVGCLLLTDHPSHDNFELVYMGLLPSVRGKGWGLDITRYAQWLTRQAGRPRLVLAVDAANDPGIRMYTMAGFRCFDRRRVFLKTF